MCSLLYPVSVLQTKDAKYLLSERMGETVRLERKATLRSLDYSARKSIQRTFAPRASLGLDSLLLLFHVWTSAACPLRAHFSLRDFHVFHHLFHWQPSLSISTSSAIADVPLRGFWMFLSGLPIIPLD